MRFDRWRCPSPGVIRSSGGPAAIGGYRARSGALVSLEILAEHTKGALEEADRAVGVLARAAAGKLPGPADEPGEVVAVGRLSGRQPRGRVRDRPQTEDARAALGGALTCHVVEDPSGRLDATRGPSQEVDDATSERGPGRPEHHGVEREVPRRGSGDPTAEIAPEEH